MKTTGLLAILALFIGCGPTVEQEAWQVEVKPIELEPTSDPVIVPADDDQPEPPAPLLKVIKIIDGDTIDVLTIDPRTLQWQRDAPEAEVGGSRLLSNVDQFNPETIRLRLNGIDTPENGQPFGKNAKKFLSDTIGGKMVRIVKHDVDRYGRTIADIYLRRDAFIKQPDMFINRELVKRGLAWHYKKDSDDEQLAQDEVEARAAKLGLWSDPRYVAPWAGGSYQKKNGTNSDEPERCRIDSNSKRQQRNAAGTHSES